MYEVEVEQDPKMLKLSGSKKEYETTYELEIEPLRSPTQPAETPGECEQNDIKLEIEIDTEQIQYPAPLAMPMPLPNNLKKESQETNFQHEMQDEENMHSHSGSKQSQYSCDQCGYTSHIESVFDKHMMAHKHKLYMCNHCTYECDSEKLLEKHIMSHDNKKLYTCNQCAYACYSESNLHAHMQTHFETSLSCDQCSYLCYNEETLNKHKLIHSPEQPTYQCEHCPLIFDFQGSLIRHMSTHTDVKPYTCDECDYTCGRIDYLHKHKVKHNRKSLLCTLCGCKFLRQSHLSQHMNTHTEISSDQPYFVNAPPDDKRTEKRYKCTLCTLRFVQSGSLRRHMVTVHSPVRPFACDECEYTCRRKDYLMKHKATHTGLHLSCTQCEAKFKRKENLNQHMKIHFNEVHYFSNNMHMFP